MKRFLLILNVFLLLILIVLVAINRSPNNLSNGIIEIPRDNESQNATDDQDLTVGADDEVEDKPTITPEIIPTKPVSSPKPTPTISPTPSLPPVADTSLETDSFGRKVVKYYYTGFSPELTEISAGDSVRFINSSYGTMWLKTTGNPGAPDFLPELDTGRSLSPGEEFIFTFLKSGSWGYMNMNHKQHSGVVVVQPR